jgi:4'-phosphopantetheinyl transferase
MILTQSNFSGFEAPGGDSITIRYLDVMDVEKDEFEKMCLQVREWCEIQQQDVSNSTHRKSTVGLWLAYQMLGMYGLEKNIIRKMSLHEFGKPFVPSTEVSFNISHSADLVVCAVAGRGNIGVDVERVRTIEWGQYKECFSRDEWHKISMASHPAYKLLELWAKKESILKADGRGLQIPLTDVMIREDQGMIKGELKTWWTYPVSIPGHICYVSADFPVNRIDAEQGVEISSAIHSQKKDASIPAS